MGDEKKVLEMLGISKQFPGTLAVNNVSLDVIECEVHALVGENGAGKSTLMKILAGSFSDYTGQIKILGKDVKLYSPNIAKKEGVGMIYQELSLALPISIAENMLAGRLPRKGIFIDEKKKQSLAKELLARVGLNDIDANALGSEISQHEAQLVEIAKALGSNPKILVMDEPTSALSAEEVKILFEIIKDLKNNGMSIIYISHHLPEIFEISDRVTVLRDGQNVGTYNIKDIDKEKVVSLMIGSTPLQEHKVARKNKATEEVFSVENFTRYGFFHNVNLRLNKGEILGIYGLCGAGRTEFARAVVGVDKIDFGKIFINKKEIRIKNISDALSKNIAYLTENRKLAGLAVRLSVSDNTMASILRKICRFGIYMKNKTHPILESLIKRLSIYPNDPNKMMLNLSGGNQQKVLLAKWLATKPNILILDEPTRGVDIGAKMLIHKTIEEMADEGTSIIVISSDLPELVRLSDRVNIMKDGHITNELMYDDIIENNILLAAYGEWNND